MVTTKEKEFDDKVMDNAKTKAERWIATSGEHEELRSSREKDELAAEGGEEEAKSSESFETAGTHHGGSSSSKEWGQQRGERSLNEGEDASEQAFLKVIRKLSKKMEAKKTKKKLAFRRRKDLESEQAETDKRRRLDAIWK